MKKIIQSLILITFITSACQKNDVIHEEPDPKSTCQDFTISTFDSLGIYHNNAMDNALDNFIADTSITNLEDGIDFVRDFNVTFLQNEMNPKYSDSLIAKEVNRNKDLIVYSRLYDSLFVYNSSKNLSVLISNVYSSGLVDSFEKDLLNRIAYCCKLNFDQTLSNAQLSDNVTLFESMWNNENYNSCDTTGYISAYTINIAKASLQWWKDNPSANKVAPVVAIDIAGALIGGAIGAGASWVGTGEVNWTSVGVGVVGGAVVASLGLVNVVANFILSIF